MSRTPRLLAALLVLLLSACSGGGSQAPVDRKESPSPKPTPTVTPVPGALGPEFFGMHDADPVADSWPDAPVGSLRVWDSGVIWSQVETAPGVFDFTRLDAIVTAAREHKATALIVLGQTPKFHSSAPKKVGSYGKGASSMPKVAAWKAYVSAVVTRYAAEDVAFQVWNEVNVEGYWRGTPQEMARLTAVARTVVDTITPAPLLVSPAMATRTLGQRAFLRFFYREKVGGRPVADLVDVVSLQLYPAVGDGPEQVRPLLTEARRILDLQGVPADKPIWDTEINYGLQGGVPAKPASPPRQQANVATTYLINAADGVQRVFWYAWDLHTIADTDLVEKDSATPTVAGRAFAEVRDWMLGTKVESCEADGQGTWLCVLTAPEGTRYVYWNPDHKVTVTTGFTSVSAQVLGQPVAALPLGGSTVPVGKLPVLVRGGSTTDLGGLPPVS